MITINKFVTSKEQPLKIQLSKPEVPLFWGGYYAAYKLNSMYVKKWHSKNTGKTIAKAEMILPINEAHKIWNDFLNHK